VALASHWFASSPNARRASPGWKMRVQPKPLDEPVKATARSRCATAPSPQSLLPRVGEGLNLISARFK